MTLRHLRIFVEVCRTGSITKAAESLHLSQPAVSLAIRQLEDYYGILLFDRISKKLYLTESGNKMLSYASHIIESFDDMETQLKNWDSAGTLRIGSSISTGTQMLPQLVRRFNLRFPQIRTQVLIDNSRIIEDKVLTNQLDLALVESLSYSPDIFLCQVGTKKILRICKPFIGGQPPMNGLSFLYALLPFFVRRFLYAASNASIIGVTGSSLSGLDRYSNRMPFSRNFRSNLMKEEVSRLIREVSRVRIVPMS